MNVEARSAAISYAESGISVIPVGSDKRPLIPSWKAFQTARAHPVQIEGWFRCWGHASIAIVCGGISGVCVMDIESDHIADIEKDWLKDNPPAAMSKRGGMHLYFAYSHEHPSRTWNEAGQHFGDFKSEGGYVVAPPSTGYRWMEPIRFPLPPVPASLVERLSVCSGAQPLPLPGLVVTPDVPSGHGSPLTQWLLDQLSGGRASNYASRSESIFAVIRSMIDLGWSNDDIIEKIMLSPIGEKYRSWRGGKTALSKEVRKARGLPKDSFEKEAVVCVGVARYLGGRMDLRLRREDGTVITQGVSQKEGPRWSSVLDAFGGDVRTGTRLMVELWERPVPGVIDKKVLRVRRFFPE